MGCVLRGGRGGRYGGVFGKKGYNMGGIADGPTSGYNVIMHGREAIVPLPDGDKFQFNYLAKEWARQILLSM